MLRQRKAIKKDSGSKKIVYNTKLLRVRDFVSRFGKVCNVSYAYTPLERWRPEMDWKFYKSYSSGSFSTLSKLTSICTFLIKIRIHWRKHTISMLDIHTEMYVLLEKGNVHFLGGKSESKLRVSSWYHQTPLWRKIKLSYIVKDKVGSNISI